MSELLAARQLVKTFPRYGGGRDRAVAEVSFTLGEGEALGLVGESGSGKSTVARLIARLIEPDSGSIILAGEDITRAGGRRLRRGAYRKMQMVFQNPLASFNPRRSLGEGIAEPLLNHGGSRAEAAAGARALLRECGLPEDYAGKYPHEVSGGECQRAAIARALAIGPQLLICDEATSALDVTLQAQVMELLSRLKRERGLAFLFICHSLALVQDFCDRVAVMKEGAIVEQGETRQIISRPGHEYTRSLIRAAL